MPIGGFVIRIETAARREALRRLGVMKEVEVHGADERGNVVAVLECETSERMERLTREIGAVDGVLAVDLVYIHAQDEVERIAGGEYVPGRSVHRRGA